MMHTVYIALGSNLETPVRQLESALVALEKLPDSRLQRISSFYQSKPIGPQDQPDYVNAVIALETKLEPLPLLDHLQRIESEQGRVRLRRWGERTLDLDILLYKDLVLQSERLTIPHYDMHNREFVIVPLYEINPALVFPDGTTLESLVKDFIPHRMEIIR